MHNNDPFKAMLGSLAFAVAGALFLWLADLSVPATITAWAVVLFFGASFCVLVLRLRRQAVRHPALDARIPRDIRIKQLAPADDEIEASWSHTSAQQPLLDVTADLWKQATPFRWQVGVGLAARVRDPVAVALLDERIHQALKGTPGVRDVGREDAEVWVVDGEPQGRELVSRAGAAVVGCWTDIVPTLQRDRQDS